MTWVLFDESDRRKPAPYFDLPGILGGKVGLDDFRGQENLMVYFPGNPLEAQTLAANHSAQSQADTVNRTPLTYLAAYMPEIRATNTQVLVVMPDQSALGRDEDFLFSLPFPFVSDPGNRTRAAYAALMAGEFTSSGEEMLFLLNEFGAAYVACVGHELDIQAIYPEAIKWLDYIAMQCPE